MTIRGNAHLPYNTYEMLSDLYFSYYLETKPYQDSGYDNNRSNKFSFGLNGYLYFYIDMHKLSSDDKWLELINETCNHILDNNDERLVEKGVITLTPLQDPIADTNYYQAPYPYQLNGTPVPGWSSFDGAPEPTPRVQLLQDGQIIGSLCSVAKYIKSENIEAYISLADTLLAHSRRVIDSHERSWREDATIYDVFIKGSYYYPNRLTGGDSVGHPLAYNHSGGFLKAALICNLYEENLEYQNKISKFLEFTKDTRVEVDGSFVWPYIIRFPEVAEDINHGSYSLDFIYEAYKAGSYGISLEDMRSYSRSLLKANRWPSVSDANERVDGTGDLPTGECFDIGIMSYLSEFDGEVLSLGKFLSATNYIPKYPPHFRSCAAILLRTSFTDR